MPAQPSAQFSVVIPTYNRAALVVRAIDSALAQEYAPAEIIVVDDGSTDATRKVVAGFGDKLRYFHQANAGVSAARNRGVREARHDWIAFLDSDDSWEPGHLRRIVDAIEHTGGEAALYFADAAMAWEGGSSYWGHCGLKVNGAWELKRDAGEWAMMRVQPMMIQASVISRTAYLKVGGLPEQLRTREDTLLFFKLAFLYPACAVSGCGTVLNSDDLIRLTQIYDHETLVYCNASISLYRELLASFPTIGRKRRQYLTHALSAAHFGMGRVLSRQGMYLSAMWRLFTSGVISPMVFTRELFGSASRREGVLINRARAVGISNKAGS